MTEPECLVCGLPGQWVVRPGGLRAAVCSQACADWIERNYGEHLDASSVEDTK